MALIENIHREDLNALDIAISYQRLIEECKLTHEKLSHRIGKKRATISNYIRLLKLPPEIQLAIRENKISMGHARALINIENEKKQLEIFSRIVSTGMNVRKVEELVKNLSDAKVESTEPAQSNYTRFESILKQLNDRLQTRMQIRINNKGKGRIVIPFDSENKLQNLLSVLGNENHEHDNT